MFKNIFSSTTDDSFISETSIGSDHIDKITTFLQSLSYWQTLNLCITLLKAQSDISYDDAKSEALTYVTDSEKMHYLLEEAINSPGPKREPIQKSLEKDELKFKDHELKFKDQLINTLIKRITILEKSSK